MTSGWAAFISATVFRKISSFALIRWNPHDGADFSRAAHLPSVFHGIDYICMGTTREHHQPLTFYFKDERLFSAEVVGFGFFRALNEQVGGTFSYEATWSIFPVK